MCPSNHWVSSATFGVRCGAEIGGRSSARSKWVWIAFGTTCVQPSKLDKKGKVSERNLPATSTATHQCLPKMSSSSNIHHFTPGATYFGPGIGGNPHWGQGYMYPEDTWWLHCDFLSTSLNKKPLDTCWVILQRKLHFDHHVPRDQIVITFEKKTPLWSQCTQRSHGDYIWKENSTKTSGFFVKENPGFFHNFVHNVSTPNLSHSLRLLS